jgi:hypothetical protein
MGEMNDGRIGRDGKHRYRAEGPYMRVHIGHIKTGDLIRFCREEDVYPAFQLYGDPTKDIALWRVEDWEKLKAWLDRKGFSDDLRGMTEIRDDSQPRG